jgi:hypothetical protein
MNVSTGEAKNRRRYERDWVKDITLSNFPYTSIIFGVPTQHSNFNHTSQACDKWKTTGRGKIKPAKSYVGVRINEKYRRI